MLCVRESMKCSRFKCSNRIENIGPRRDQHHNEGKSGEENNSARRRADIWRRNNVKKNGECCKVEIRRRAGTSCTVGGRRACGAEV